MAQTQQWKAARPKYDAIVVGSGPNGLAAAVELARQGCSVLVLEAADTVGGGTRSGALTLPGYLHDICSAIHPLGATSPFFRTLPLSGYGLEWIDPPSVVAHPFDDGSVAVLERSIEATVATLGDDADAYRKLIGPFARNWRKLAPALLGPLRPPRHPIALALFGLRAIRSARGLAESVFKGEQARGLFAGLAAHAFMPLEMAPTAAFGLVLAAVGHASGWPLARGGSQRIADALAQYFRSLGGEIVTGVRVESLDELPAARAVLFDLGPHQMARIAGDRLPAGYRRKLERFRYGPGAFKVDYALDGPIPWKASECARAGTVHLGGTLAEIADSERATWEGRHHQRPFVLVAQQSMFDPSRAPAGKHTVWSYCHVPHGSTTDMTEVITAQFERFAPGFRDRIIAHHSAGPADLQRGNANYIGGDITGGVADFRQLFTRPTARTVPYSTPARGLYICSASTPPGGGVHGMCGYHAARAALGHIRRDHGKG